MSAFSQLSTARLAFLLGEVLFSLAGAFALRCSPRGFWKPACLGLLAVAWRSACARRHRSLRQGCASS